MRRREQFVASIMVTGLSLLLAGLSMVIAMSRSIASYTPSNPQTQVQTQLLLKQLFGWGTAVVVFGCLLFIVIYLARRWGLRRVYPGATITTRFYTNRQGEMVVYPMGYAPTELCYYVRLRLPNGEGEEFECTPALFQRLREGMEGTAVCRGNCLLAFYPVSASV